MNRLRKIVTSFLLMLLVFSSCTEKQDFDQRYSVEIRPTVEASILYVEAPERIVNLVTGASFFTQDFNFDGFSSTIFSDRVIEGTITYIVENTTSKELEITVEFLDEGNNVLDTEVFSIQPAPTEIVQREIAYGDNGRSIDIIKNSSGIRVSALNLGDNTSTSSLPDPKITLKSSGKFRVRLR